MADEKPKEPTALERLLEHTGSCGVATGACECKAFAYTGTKDGFRTCVCSHTQHIHARGES